MQVTSRSRHIFEDKALDRQPASDSFHHRTKSEDASRMERFLLTLIITKAPNMNTAGVGPGIYYIVRDYYSAHTSQALLIVPLDMTARNFVVHSRLLGPLHGLVARGGIEAPRPGVHTSLETIRTSSSGHIPRQSNVHRTHTNTNNFTHTLMVHIHVHTSC